MKFGGASLLSFLLFLVFLCACFCVQNPNLLLLLICVCVSDDEFHQPGACGSATAHTGNMVWFSLKISGHWISKSSMAGNKVSHLPFLM